jgi:pimeloyl-ACP methyl ester carboxylesterase
MAARPAGFSGAIVRPLSRRPGFAGIASEMLSRLVLTYGVPGAIRALRNMDVTQRRLLPELASLNVPIEDLSLDAPIHYIIGERDPLKPPVLARRLSELSSSSGHAVTVLPSAGHMAHFDRPDVVKPILASAIAA